VNWRSRAEPPIEEPLSETPWPLAAKKLLTERERSLYQSLLDLYPERKLFVQVALSQLIDVPKNHPDRQSIRNRFSQLVADFVLCRADLSVVAVIELDDPSHERADRQAADARKNKALADAGIRLVRIPAGRLPASDTLRALIDADGTHGHGPQEEVVLTLAEDTYSPENPYGLEDESSAVSREFKRVALKGLAGIVLLIVGWLVVSQLLPVLVRLAFQPLSRPQVRTAVAMPKTTLLTPRQNGSGPVIARPTAEELAESQRAQGQEASVLQKQKNLAWAAFYSAPASCEHPIDWAAQVECGNQYIRAKRVFEQRWEAEHPSSQGSREAVILDNSSVGSRHK
jgi:very-short-patch-repair endonuclease